MPDPILPRPAMRPRRRPPPGACDCHIHISDGTGRFPIRRPTGYKPSHAPFEVHRAMLEATGLERSVAAQLMAYADDNAAMVEALVKSAGTMRGVAELGAQASDAELERLHAAGVRGLRFYIELPKPVPGLRQFQGVGLQDLVALAPRMKALSWVAQISASCARVVALAPQLQALGVPIVLEHMAGCTADIGADGPLFRSLLGFLETGMFWVKLSIGAMSGRADFADMRPLHDAFIAAAPGRMIWGSNWPYGMSADVAPDVGRLLDVFDDWVEHDEGLRQAILSDNPARLFGFPQT